MSYYNARKNLGALHATSPKEVLKFPVPQDGKDYLLVARIAGTFVGTVMLMDDLGGWAEIATTEIASTGATAATPTGVGNFAAAVPSGAENARVVFSAYTSGSVDVEAVLIPLSA